MGFHNVRLPTNLSQGSSFGPGFNTSLIELQSGQVQSRARWGGAGKRRYNLAYSLRKPADLAELRNFFIARTGALNTWRMKDWEDYATSSTGTTHNPTDASVTNADVLIGTGDGAETQFQLFKSYASGDQTVNRTIELPVAGTVLVAVDGAAQTLGADFTVNETTGVVTFSTAPADTLEVTAGFEFDVKARFGAEVDRSLDIDLGEFNIGSIGSIDVLEELPGGAADPEMAWHGGSVDHGTLGANFTMTLAQGRAHRVSPTADILAILPPITSMPSGGPVFALKNAGGSNTVELVYDDETTTVVTVAAGGFVELWVVPSSGGLKAWQSK